MASGIASDWAFVPRTLVWSVFCCIFICMDSSAAQVVNGETGHLVTNDVQVDYSLHQAVFHGHQVPKSMPTISPEQINCKDIHGNTPLHLAVILGRHEWVHHLIALGANILARNKQGWTPLAEAISYGDRSISKYPLPPLQGLIFSFLSLVICSIATNMD